MQDLECSPADSDFVNFEWESICTREDEECWLSRPQSPWPTILTVTWPSSMLRHSSCVKTAPCATRRTASDMDAAECFRSCMLRDSVFLCAKRNRSPVHYTNLAGFVKEGASPTCDQHRRRQANCGCSFVTSGQDSTSAPERWRSVAWPRQPMDIRSPAVGKSV